MTMGERIAAAKAAMAKIHAGIAMAQEGASDLGALDTPENVADLDARDVRALRRELDRLNRMVARADDEAGDVHAALNEIAFGSPVISPQFGK